MRSRLLAPPLGALLALAVVAGSASADENLTGAPNQGNPDMVRTVDIRGVSCEKAVPGKKIEGDFGHEIFFVSYHPIDYVTVKSGKDASLVFAEFGHDGDKYWGKIKLSKDVSNYVVWVCKDH